MLMVLVYILTSLSNSTFAFSPSHIQALNPLHQHHSLSNVKCVSYLEIRIVKPIVKPSLHAHFQSFLFMSVGNEEKKDENDSDIYQKNTDEKPASPKVVKNNPRNVTGSYSKDASYMEDKDEPLWQRRRKERLNRGPERNRRYQDMKHAKKTTVSDAPQNKPQNEKRKSKTVPTSEFMLEDLDLESTSRIAMKMGSTAASAAKYAANDFSKRMRRLAKVVYDFNNVDKNGVREAKWKYVSNVDTSKDEYDNVKTKRMHRRASSKSFRRRSSKGDIPSDQGVTIPVEEPRVVIPEILNALPPKLQDVDYIPDLENEDIPKDSFAVSSSSNQAANPPASSKTNDQTSRKKRLSNDKKKNVYSVYPITEDEKHSDMEDLYGELVVNAIDTVGDFVADITEGKYWTNRTQSNIDSTSNNTSSRSSRGTPSSKSYKRRYWRDRLTEKVDYALGVHEDGKYYKSWQDQLELEKARGVGSDAVSIFYGRQRKHRGPKKSVPFWEEDGSLMSLFFGRTPEGRTLTLSKLFERENSVNICTTIFKSSFQTALAILSYLCRWASCRGALPQPIVVFFLAAAAVSAPKRRRLMTVSISLVALRTLAEAIHGYMYGNENWEDDDSLSEENTNAEREGDGL